MINEYQQRVIEEKRQLDGKIGRLDEFCRGARFDGVEPDERERMLMQLALMRRYSAVLGSRIEGFRRGP